MAKEIVLKYIDEIHAPNGKVLYIDNLGDNLQTYTTSEVAADGHSASADYIISSSGNGKPYGDTTDGAQNLAHNNTEIFAANSSSSGSMWGTLSHTSNGGALGTSDGTYAILLTNENGDDISVQNTITGDKVSSTSSTHTQWYSGITEYDGNDLRLTGASASSAEISMYYGGGGPHIPSNNTRITKFSNTYFVSFDSFSGLTSGLYESRDGLSNGEYSTHSSSNGSSRSTVWQVVKFKENVDSILGASIDDAYGSAADVPHHNFGGTNGSHGLLAGGEMESASDQTNVVNVFWYVSKNTARISLFEFVFQKYWGTLIKERWLAGGASDGTDLFIHGGATADLGAIYTEWTREKKSFSSDADFVGWGNVQYNRIGGGTVSVT
jgi:hypothetical protein